MSRSSWRKSDILSYPFLNTTVKGNSCWVTIPKINKNKTDLQIIHSMSKWNLSQITVVFSYLNQKVQFKNLMEKSVHVIFSTAITWPSRTNSLFYGSNTLDSSQDFRFKFQKECLTIKSLKLHSFLSLLVVLLEL